MTRTHPAPEPGKMVLNLVEMCRDGFWKCRSCGHLTFPVDEKDPIEPTESRAVCGLCASPAIQFVAPVLPPEPGKK